MSDDITTAEGLIESGRYDEAIALLDVVLAVAPDDPVALYQLGSAHDSAGHEAEAVEPYRRALAAGLDPEMALAGRIQLASTLRNLGETRESVEILEAAVAEHPQYRAARMFLALALVSDGRATEAVHLLLDLLLTNPGPPERYARSLRNYTDDLGRTSRIDQMIADGRITPARGRPRDLPPPPPPTDPTGPTLSEILQEMRDDDPR